MKFNKKKKKKKKKFNVCPSENNLFYHYRYDAVLQKYCLLITLSHDVIS